MGKMARKMTEDNVKLMLAKGKLYEQKAIIETEKNKHAVLEAEVQKLVEIKRARAVVK